MLTRQMTVLLNGAAAPYSFDLLHSFSCPSFAPSPAWLALRRSLQPLRLILVWHVHVGLVPSASLAALLDDYRSILNWLASRQLVATKALTGVKPISLQTPQAFPSLSMSASPTTKGRYKLICPLIRFGIYLHPVMVIQTDMEKSSVDNHMNRLQILVKPS